MHLQKNRVSAAERWDRRPRGGLSMLSRRASTLARFSASDALGSFVRTFEEPKVPGLGTGFVAGSGCQSWDSLAGLSEWCGADALFRDKTTGRRMNLMQYQQQPEDAVGYLFEFVGHPQDSNDKHSILHNRLREGFNTPEFALPERDLFERPEYSQQVRHRSCLQL